MKCLNFDISAEMLKSHNGIAEWLWDIVNKCWTEEDLPQDWKLAEVVPLYKKKGKRSECGNYRGISLLSVPGKFFASIILNRYKDALDQVLREEQCGFRKCRGCIDQLFALRQIVKKCMAFQLNVSFCFIDFRAAFDLVDREMMYKIMKHYGLPQNVMNVICNSYNGFKCCVKAEGEKGQMFDVKTGVRQGDVWSPILFGLVINYVLANSFQGGINIGRCVADLDFADDVALLGGSDSEVQASLHRIESSAEAVGLMINVGKTKNMGVKCEKPGASVPIAQKNVEDLTGNHKGRYGTLIETKNQSRLIGREVLVGKKKNAGWFETLAGEKLRLKSSAEDELVTVSGDERSVVADLVSMASNRSSAVSDDESCVCSGCKRRFETARGCKVLEARFCKSMSSKSVKDSASKFVGLENTVQKCSRKFATVKGRQIHESRSCGREKAGRSRIFSCNVQDRDGVEFENVEAFKYLGSFVSLLHGDLKEISVKLAEGRQRFASFEKLWKSKQLSIPLKCKLYRALVLSVFLYSSETWTRNKSTQRKLESFHTSCLRRILCFSYMEKVKNEEVLARSRMSTLFAMIMIKRLKWFGHVLRMNDDRLALRAFTWEPTKDIVMLNELQGGQRKTWQDQLEEDCSRNNMSYITLRQITSSKSVKDSASKFVGLENSLTCQKCSRKFATVKGRQIHESRYCGREKAGRSRIFSCNVQDRDGVEFENVEAFKYLGSFVSLLHGDLKEISVKLAEGRQRFASFEKLWKSKQLSIPLKCKLYRALVLSVFLYSSETWTRNNSTQRKLESFHTSCLRRILCFSYMEKVKNEEVLARSRMSTLFAMIMIKRLKWFGHVLRMNDDRLALRAFTWEPTKNIVMLNELQGGQRKTWQDQLEEDCSRNNMSYITLRQITKRESKSRFNSFVKQHFLD